VKRLLAVGAALLLLAGGLAGAYALWGRAELKTDGPLVVTDADWRGAGVSPAAIGAGVLSIDGDCVRLRDSPVVWPDGTSWDEDEQSVRLPGDRLARPGDTIGGGGGYFTFEREDEDSRLGRLLGDCVSLGDEVLVFNATEHLELDRADAG
jgi:hypothetical protein